MKKSTIKTQKRFSVWLKAICIATLGLWGTTVELNAAVSNYTFSQSSGVYAPLSASRTVVFLATAGATLDPGLGDDMNFTLPAGTIPFTFNFDGTGYTGININTNGYVTFGATLPLTSDRSGISNSTAWNGSIVARGSDLSANTDAANLGEISYEVIGSAPNRQFVIQYYKFRRFASSTPMTENFNFQIILNEANGVASNQTINIVYGACISTSTTSTCQVGLRGPNNTFPTNVNNRQCPSPQVWNTSTAGVSNSSTMRHNTTVNPASGQTFTWTPPNNCSVALGGTVTPSSYTKCAGQTQAMSSTSFSTGLGTTYQWMVSSTSGSGYTPISGATNTSYTTSALTAGTYYYVMQTTCANCGPCTGLSNEVTMVVNSLPTISVTPGSGVICNPGGAAVNLTATGASTYAWSPTAGLTPTTGSPVAAFPTSSTVYTVTGTDGNGCTATSTASININAGVSLGAITATPSNVCPNGSSVLSASGTFVLPAYCQSTHTSGCSGDDIISVTLNTLVNTNSACGLSGSTPARYLYQSGPTAPTTTLAASSTYTISLSFGTDGNQYFGAWIDYNQNGSLETTEFLGASANAGASGTTTVVFTVPAGAFNGKTRLRVIGGNDSPLSSGQACGASSSGWGETQDFDVTISGGANAFTYTWSESPNTTLSSLSGPSVNANNIPSTSTYTVVASSAAGCTASATLTMTISPLACSAPTYTTACANTNFTITANTVGGGAPFSYVWDDGMSGVYPNSQNITTNLAAGNYTFSVTVSDACGNSCNTSVAVTVNANPTGTAAGSTTAVTYQPLSYNVTGFNPGDNFQWQFSTSATGPWTNIGTNNSTLSTTASSAGTFYVQCVITNASGCTLTTNQITTVVTVAGNEPCSAVALPLGVSGPYTNIGASADAGEPVPASNGCNVQNGWCNSTLENTVWFSFVAPPSGRVVINTGAPLWDDQMALYSVTNCGDYLTYTQLAANDDGGDGSFAAKITSICLVPGQTYYLQVDGYNGASNGAFYLNLIEETAGVQLAAKAMLSGAYDASLGLMHDSIRSNGLVPLTEPYTSAPYSKPAIGEPSGETTTSTVLGVTGNNAIVDWVYIELRNSTTPSTIVATKRALIQRDGDIVGVDGVSPVSFPSLSYGSYYVSVKHRNHLGVMTATPVILGPCTLGTVDFINGAVWVKPGEVNGPRRMFGAIGTLWSSDANRNKNSKYNGLSNDKQEVLNAVGVGTPNNALGPVYRAEDLNMDTKVRYNNTDNDRNVIANTVGVNTPNNIVNQHTPN